jgi:hypothetical protein
MLAFRKENIPRLSKQVPKLCMHNEMGLPKSLLIHVA